MSQHFDEVNRQSTQKLSPDNTFFWSRAPGRFVNKRTGEEAKPGLVKRKELTVVSETTLDTNPKTVVRVLQEREVMAPNQGPQFFGTVREWYETLVETIIDASNTLFKRHLQAPSVVEVGPDLLTILEHCVGYKPNYKVDSDGMTIPPDEVLPMTRGVFVGTLSNRLKVVKVDTMKHNEACVVIITQFKTSVVKTPPDPHKDLNLPVSDELKQALKIPSFEEDFQPRKIPEVNIEPLPSLQRLDEFTVHVLDMSLL